jgi:hypothetical protein
LVACEPEKLAGECGGEFCAADQRCDDDSLRCVLDEPPTVTLTPIAAVVTSANISLSGSLGDDVAVTRATWSLEGSEPVEFTARSDGKFTIPVPAPAVDERPLKLDVVVSDGKNEATASIDVRVDRVGPTIELVAPAMGGTIGGAMPRVTLRATDGSRSVGSVSVDGKVVPGVMHDTTFYGPVTVPANSARVPVSVVVSAADMYGNMSSTTFALFGDTVAPTLAVTKPAADDTVVATDLLRLEGTASDPTPLTVRVSGLDAGAVVATLDGGAWIADVAIPEIEATETLSIEASDGLQSTIVARRIRIDRVAPQATIVVPARDAIVGPMVTVTVNVTGSPASVQAQLGTGAPVVLAGGPTSWTGQVAGPSVDFDARDLVVTVRDAAGNESTARTSVIVDNVAPVISFIAPAADRKFNIADFASTNDVTVSWGLQDGDPQAAQTQVNGSASTATSLLITTAPTDNGRVVTTTVTATDRAGNVGTGTRTFSVDRVRPMLLSWAPLANSRNVENGVRLDFSEPVFGATTSTDAVVITPAITSGSWTANHDVWTSGALTPYSVFTAQLATNALADSHGNAVLTAELRRFSTAAAAISGDHLLRSSVLSFRAVSDADGRVTVATKSLAGVMPNFVVQSLSPSAMTLEAPLASSNAVVTTFELNAWNYVDPVALTARPVVGAYWYIPCTGAPCVNQTETRRWDSGAQTFTSSAGPFVLSAGPLQAESNRAELATINGPDYVRGTAAPVTLPFSPQPVVAQSGTSWAAFATVAGRVKWARLSCRRSLSLTTCGPEEYGVDVTGTPSALSMAMNPAGTCLAAAWDDSSGRRVVYVPQATFCSDPTSDPLCNSPPVPAAVTAPAGIMLTPWNSPLGAGLLAAWRTTGGVGLFTNTACSTVGYFGAGTLQSSTVLEFAPVQVGARAGLVYRNSSNELRLFIP